MAALIDGIRGWISARVEELGRLIEGGADVEEEGGGIGMNWEAPSRLVGSARGGHVVQVIMLLQSGADVTVKDKQGWTALHHAAVSGHEQIVELLIHHGADSSAKNNKGLTPEDLATGYPTVGHDQQRVRTIIAILKAETERRAKCFAFAMGLHERLGAGSCVQGLDPGVARIVLDLFSKDVSTLW